MSRLRAIFDNTLIGDIASTQPAAAGNGESSDSGSSGYTYVPNDEGSPARGSRRGWTARRIKARSTVSVMAAHMRNGNHLEAVDYAIRRLESRLEHGPDEENPEV